MTILNIPTFSENASFEEIVNLEGVNYKLRIYWNVRDEFWYMDISLTDDTLVVEGLKLVTNYDLLGLYVEENVPPGTFFLYDNTASEQPCGRFDLGNGYDLVYITSDDEFLVSS